MHESRMGMGVGESAASNAPGGGRGGISAQWFDCLYAQYVE